MSLGGNRLAQAGALLLIAVAVLALLGPLLIDCSPLEIDLRSRLAGPSAGHPLGCDQLGRDILARVVFGARISLTIGLLVTAVSVVVGTLLGMIAGFRGGWVDLMFSWLFDTALAIPGLLLAIAVIAILGPSFLNLVIALCVMGWVGYARLARGLTLRARENDYVAAAKVDGKPVHHFDVSASYALGGFAGMNETRMSWLFEKFSELTVNEIMGKPSDQ